MSSQNPFIIEVASELGFPSHLLSKAQTKWGVQRTREIAMATSVGGIGPLVRERTRIQSEKGLNVIGVSLLYEYVWIQKLLPNGTIQLQKKSVGKECKQLLTPTSLKFSLWLFNNQKLDVVVW
ncbi:hypothetical protein BVX98_02440, partial [bacterium F11]